MAGELNVQTLLSRPTVPVMNVEQLVYCLLEMRPAETVATGSPLPLNLSLVLDRHQPVDQLRVGVERLQGLVEVGAKLVDLTLDPSNLDREFLGVEVVMRDEFAVAKQRLVLLGEPGLDLLVKPLGRALDDIDRGGDGGPHLAHGSAEPAHGQHDERG